MSAVHEGTWWVADHRPESEVRRLNGRLTIDERGRAVLVTAGFVPLLIEPVNGVWSARSTATSALVVHGQTTMGGRITLLHVRGNMNRLLADAVVEGVWLHLGRPDDLDPELPVPVDRRADLVPAEKTAVFSGVDVELEHLAAWSASETLRRVMPRTPQHDTVPLVQRAVHVEPTATLEDGTTVALVSKVGMRRHDTVSGSQVTVNETIQARIRTPAPVDLDTLLVHVGSLRRLLSLTVRRETGVLSVMLHHADRDTVEDAAPHRATDGAPLLQLHKRFPPVIPAQTGAVPRSRMLFTLEHVDFAELLPRWRQVADELDGTMATLTTAHEQTLLMDTRLVAAVTAAESYFAGRADTAGMTRMPAEDFAQLRELIGTTLADHPHLGQYKGFVLDSLRNQPTLRQRLHELVDHLGEHAEPLLTSRHTTRREPDPGSTGPAGSQPASDQPDGAERAAAPSELPEATAWAWAASKARNDAAHGGVVSALDFDTAWITLDVTMAIVELLVLRDLGVNDERLAELVRDRHHDLAGRVREHLMPAFTEVGTAHQPAARKTRLRPDTTVDREPEPDDGLDPLVAALLDVAGSSWRREWAPWAAVAAALRRRGALPVEADTHDHLVQMLADTLGPAVPAAVPGRKAMAGPGYTTLSLFIAVNDHCLAIGRELPWSRWRRHPDLHPVLDTLPLLADAIPDTATDVATATLKTDGRPSDQRNLQHLLALIANRRPWTWRLPPAGG
ncbi:HEPN domain-containing protein [Saccharothrix xinjiangensis]|uniref:HEPN domain-containing protein n=1 Tax=Saccharothrix xinjiangensis TaxID=204798 RepID=A0ABV9Y2K2_9PSEU